MLVRVRGMLGTFDHARRHQFSEDRIPSVLQSVLAIDLPFHVDAAMVVCAYAHKCLKFVCLKFVRLLKKLSSHIHASVLFSEPFRLLNCQFMTMLHIKT